MARLLAIVGLLFVLVGCATGAPVTPCPDPDSDPTSPCATSHGQTHGMM